MGPVSAQSYLADEDPADGLGSQVPREEKVAESKLVEASSGSCHF